MWGFPATDISRQRPSEPVVWVVPVVLESILMSRFKSPKLLAGWFVLAGLLPALSAQDKPAEPPAAPQLVPAVGQTGFGRTVDDIDLHRVEAAPYVRRFEDVVQLNAGDIDIEADVILTIDGKPITQNDFRKRAIMYLAVNRVDEELTRMVTETQRARLIAEGVDPESLAILESDLDEKVENLIAMVVMQARGPNAEANPDGAEAAAAKARQDFLDSIEASVGMETYRQMMGAEVAFEKVFLPMPTEPQDGEVWDLANGPPPDDDPKPDWLPQITWDALGTDPSGKQLRTFIKGHGAKGDPIPSFFRGQITTTIRAGVLKLQGVKYFFDADLPDDVFLRLGDTDLNVDLLWDRVKNDIADTDIDLIIRELLTLRSIRTTLESAGQWMDGAATAQAYAELNAQFEGTLFPLNSIIVIRGYRSLDRYREHWRHKEAYFRWRKKSLTDEEVEEHYRTSGRLFFERGSAEVDLAHKPLDFDNGPFSDARFAEADADMEAAFGVAEMEGMDSATFREIAKLFPRPATRQTEDNPDPEADRYFQRNPLRIRLTESEMSMFITGYSMADDIYYHGVPGEVFGPYGQRCRRHAWGAEVNAGSWMARLNGFTRDRPLAPLTGRDLDQATEDYLDLSYQYWAQECLKSVLPKVKFTTKN
jgi:hypothetical protein